MLDLSLAIGHHLLIFAILGIICAEFWAVRLRRYLHLELGLFFLLPVFAAAMARGYGQF